MALTIFEVANIHKGRLGGYFNHFTSDSAHRAAMAALPLLFYFSATVYPAFSIPSTASLVMSTRGDVVSIYWYLVEEYNPKKAALS
jgi:hypothetical protein